MPRSLAELALRSAHRGTEPWRSVRAARPVRRPSVCPSTVADVVIPVVAETERTRSVRPPRSGALRLWRLAPGKPSAVDIMPVCPSASSATNSVSFTVSSGKRVADWKVRPESEACSPRRRHVANLVPEKSHRTLARHESADGVHERRLAGAVAPDEPDDLLAADGQRGIVDRHDPAEATRSGRTRPASGSDGTGPSTVPGALRPDRPRHGCGPAAKPAIDPADDGVADDRRRSG